MGKPKGTKRVLQERGLWKEGILKQCVALPKGDTEADAQYNARKDLDRGEWENIAAQ